MDGWLFLDKNLGLFETTAADGKKQQESSSARAGEPGVCGIAERPNRIESNGIDESKNNRLFCFFFRIGRSPLLERPERNSHEILL